VPRPARDADLVWPGRAGGVRARPGRAGRGAGRCGRGRRDWCRGRGVAGPDRGGRRAEPARPGRRRGLRGPGGECAVNGAVPRELANRDVVVAELGVLRTLLRDGGGDAAGADGGGPGTAAARAALAAARARLARPSTLDELANGFGLTPFERSVLLLAAGPELVAAVAEELTAATGLPRLTFGTALAVLPEAHWSALTPPAPLRRWSLVRLLDPSSPTRSPLLVDERVLHHLAGAGHLDEYLAALSRPLAAPGPLPATLARCADAVAAAWQLGRAARVHGPQPANVQAVVAAAADRAGLD